MQVSWKCRFNGTDIRELLAWWIPLIMHFKLMSYAYNIYV